MKIAVAKDGKQVSSHLGHYEGFEIYHVVNKAVSENSFLVNPGHRPGFLPKFIAEKGIDIIVAEGTG